MKVAALVLTVFLLACSIGCGTTTKNAVIDEGLSVTTIPSDVIYNMTRDVKIGTESDFLVKMVKIANEGSDTIEVKSVSFTVFSDDKQLLNIIYEGSELDTLFQDYINKFEKMSYDFIEGIFLGKLGVANLSKTSKSSTIKPGEEAGILNIPFRLNAEKPATLCKIAVKCQQGSETYVKESSLKISEYTSKNKYIFPVKGAWTVLNTYNANYTHRINCSQEFAFDLMVQESDFMMYPPSGKNEDYGCWGKEVVASAGGTVVDVVDGVPNNPSFLGSRLSKEELDKIKDSLGPTAMLAGNYVVLEHQNGEFSLYAHMIIGSVKVKKGDKVNQGQLLGLCGNAGNSDAPHMHFHLMDGPSILTSRGLPIRFTNLRDSFKNKIEVAPEPNVIIFAE